MTANNSKSLPNRVKHIALIYYRALNHIYALFIILHIILRLVVGERWVFVAFLDTFAHIFWLIGMILCGLNLIFRQRNLALIMLPAVFAFLLTWGTMFLPKNRSKAASADIPLRILTFNLYGNNSELDAIERLIREVDADIVAVQELSDINSPALENLKDIYPYMGLHTTQIVTQGQGILSRYPISNDSFWIDDFAANMLGKQRVEITLENNHTIVLYNVHPSHPGMQDSFFDPQYRSIEINAILERSAKETLPHLLLGDFNMPDMSDDYAHIRSYYTDAYRVAGFGMGWSFPNKPFIPPFLRLDYLFYNGDFIAQNAQVWSCGAGSDHRPLVVDLYLLNQ